MRFLRPNLINCSTACLRVLTIFLTLSASGCNWQGAVPLCMQKGGAEEGGNKKPVKRKHSSGVTQGTDHEEERDDSSDDDSSLPSSAPLSPLSSPPRKRTRTREPVRRLKGKRIKRTKREYLARPASSDEEKQRSAQPQKQLEELCVAVEKLMKEETGELQSLGNKLLEIAKLKPGKNYQDRVRAITAYPSEQNPVVLAHALLEAVRRYLGDKQSVSAQTLVYLAQLSKFEDSESPNKEDSESRNEARAENFKNIFKAVFKLKGMLKEQLKVTNKNILSTLQSAFEKAYGGVLVQNCYKKLREEAIQRKKVRQK